MYLIARLVSIRVQKLARLALKKYFFKKKCNNQPLVRIKLQKSFHACRLTSHVKLGPINKGKKTIKQVLTPRTSKALETHKAVKVGDMSSTPLKSIEPSKKRLFHHKHASLFLYIYLFTSIAIINPRPKSFLPKPCHLTLHPLPFWLLQSLPSKTD